MDAPYYNGDALPDMEPREPACHECGSEPEDGHDVTCSYHPDFYEPDERDYEPSLGDA